MSETLKWRKMKKRHIAQTETLLQSQERWCMNACSRYLHRGAKDSVWTLRNKAGDIFALIVQINQNLLPVLCGRKDIPPPHFLRGLFGAVSIHSLQGRTEDALIMESELEKIGLSAAEKIDYDLMCMDNSPSARYVSYGPMGLVIRKPQSADMDALAALQAAYEREEVLPAASEFSAAVSRLNIEHIYAKEQMLVAELGGHLIGKINTNAFAFTRCQVGGVYVDPSCRGQGIASRMAGEFTTGLAAQGRGISLFVKKSNPSARRVYQRLGYEILGDYRINYY
ncbi:MAG: GNAT family N-acetyltransferase [Treponema sp.]|jgi:predicted GNAT family acetyltransferase|nr:GNAT family N-acetyltransferase [Treponema sp.]